MTRPNSHASSLVAPKAIPLPPEELRDFLDRIARWDAAAWLAHRKQYLATYAHPMPFLPPECASAVVLQATLGNHGRFGSGLARSTEPDRRTPDEFRQHARDVAALWGRRLLQSRTLFLGGSDVLHLPTGELISCVKALANVFPIESPSPRLRGAGRDVGHSDHGRTPSPSDVSPSFEGIHVFLDDFVPGHPDPSAWKEIASLGVKRVSLGIASGDPDVRSLYQERWSNQALCDTFADLKSAGLAQVCSRSSAPAVPNTPVRHIKQTAALITSLDLAPGDFVFLLDENELRAPDSLPALKPLQGEAWQHEQTALKDALAILKDRKIKVLPYTMEKQGI